MIHASELEKLLHAVGEILALKKVSYGIVVVGGASISLLGLVPRATNDVDVIATTGDEPQKDPIQIVRPPEPLPKPLREAITRVHRDFDLPADWINTDIAAQWQSGLPPGFPEQLQWRQYGNLSVGLARRPILIYLKLFAAVDTGPESVHYQDLLAMKPDEAELRQAARWVRKQDASPNFAAMVDQVVKHLLQEIQDKEG